MQHSREKRIMRLGLASPILPHVIRAARHMHMRTRSKLHVQPFRQLVENLRPRATANCENGSFEGAPGKPLSRGKACARECLASETPEEREMRLFQRGNRTVSLDISDNMAGT